MGADSLTYCTKTAADNAAAINIPAMH